MAQVKSRMMGDPSYKGTIDCFVKTLKADVSKLFFCVLSGNNTTPEKVHNSLSFVFLDRVLWHFTRVSSPTLDALAHGTSSCF